MKTLLPLCVLVFSVASISPTFGAESYPSVDALPLRRELPDPLVSSAGAIRTRAAWEERRQEIKHLLSFYAVGHVPPAPGNVVGRTLDSRRIADGKVQYQLVHLSFGPESKLGFDIAVFTPAAGTGPFPTIVFPSFELTPGAKPLPTLPRRPEQGQGKDALSLPLGIPEPSAPAKPLAPTDPEAFALAHRDVMERGYALVTYHYQDCGEDTIARNLDGTWAFRNTRFFPAYSGYDWGLLGAWAWGASRVADFLQTQSFADKTQLIITGHSRIGKAVLVAGAFDERFALSAPAGSAGGGVGAYRLTGFGRGGAEGLDDITLKYPNWFSPQLRAFRNDADKLPFDQHWFVALTAPRPFIELDGAADRICSPFAVRRSLGAALPIYALYGAEAKVGVNFGAHGHAYAPEDWAALLDFADVQLRGSKLDRDFRSKADQAGSAHFNVRETGAAGDGATKDTEAFQRALDACGATGGGEVVVPAGNYLVGSIELRPRTTIRLAEGARIVGSSDVADYPLTRIRWEGRWVQGHRALIFASDADQIAIVGPGHIAGPEALGRLRDPRAPALIEPLHCSGVRLEGFSTTHASMWSIHPTRCAEVTASHLKIRSTGGNGDGIDVDSCRNVHVDHCDIDTGDDSIALKSGRGLEGFRAAEPSENITITDCTLGDANYACIGIGSEMSGSIRNVTIERCTFTHSKTNSIYIKGRPGRGGVIESITARDLSVVSADGAFLRINLLKSGKEGEDPVPAPKAYRRVGIFPFLAFTWHTVEPWLKPRSFPPKNRWNGFRSATSRVKVKREWISRISRTLTLHVFR